MQQFWFFSFFSCDQAALGMVQSVHPSVTPFSLCPHYDIILKFSGVITNGRCEVRAKGQRSKVKFTEFKTQLSRFRIVTPVWIHIWWWNDAQSLMLLMRGALFFLMSSVKFQDHTVKKILDFDQNWAFPDCNSTSLWIHWWLWNAAQSLKQYRRVALLFFKVIRQIPRSHGTKNCRFCPDLSVISRSHGLKKGRFESNLSRITWPVAAIKFLEFALFWIVCIFFEWALSMHTSMNRYSLFLAATKQLYDWFSPSVCPSVRLPVCPSHLFHHVSIIVSSWNFQELLPWSEVMSMQKVKVRGQRSRSQRSTPNLAVSGL